MEFLFPFLLGFLFCLLIVALANYQFNKAKRLQRRRAIKALERVNQELGDLLDKMEAEAAKPKRRRRRSTSKN